MNSVQGTAGANVVHGTADPDYFSDSLGGNDEFYGEDGDDILYASRGYQISGSVLLDGGAGHDNITFASDLHAVSVVIRGGTGNDKIDSSGGASCTIDAGAGEDLLVIDHEGTSYNITLGDGADIVGFSGVSWTWYPGPAIVFTDFAAGAGGDRLALDRFLAKLTGWDADQSPFATGHLALVQRGADAVLQIDRNGGGDGYMDFAILQNVAVASLTAANIGFDPTGAPTPGLSLAGTNGDDQLFGSGGADVIDGGLGGDEIDGGAGNDVIHGGDNNDRLNGQFGDDQVFGGAGTDMLTEDYGGDDQLFGEGGSDNLTVTRLNDSVPSTLLLDGGDGDDRFYFFSSAYRRADHLTMIGGAGADDINVDGGLSANIDAGEGADTLHLTLIDTSFTITLGAGADRVIVGNYNFARLWPGTICFTDFQGGNLGDRLELNSSLLRGKLDAWDGVSDPFAAGDLRLAQRGADTLLQTDRDGDGRGYETLITFSNMVASSLTSYNFNGYQPGPIALVGTEGADSLAGGGQADTIEGMGGDDSISIAGNGTGVVVDGGAGGDTVTLGAFAGSATLALGTGQDVLAFSGYTPGGALAVSDFQAGNGGDRLEWTDFLGAWLTGWDGSADPFAAGYLGLVQSGADTLLRIDRDGAAGPGGFATFLTLKNVSAAALTAANLDGIDPVNDAPVNILPGPVATTEDMAAFITGLQVSDVDAGSTALTVTLSVGHGILTVSPAVPGGLAAADISGNGTGAVTLTGTIDQINATLASATGVHYQPAPDFSGADALMMATSDNGGTGTGGARSDTDSIAIGIAAINDAPAGADKNFTIDEDQARVLTAADFGFGDADGNGFAGVVVATLPGAGTLFLDADGPGGAAPVALAGGQFVAAADIAAGRLSYVPGANGNGANYAGFTFQVRDDGGTAGNGADTDPTANSFTVHATAVNDAPILGAAAQALLDYVESAAAIPLFAGVTITDPDLPAAFAGGTLQLTTSGAGARIVLIGSRFTAQEAGGTYALTDTLTGQQVGVMTATADGVTLSLSAAATADAVNALAQAFGFQTVGASPAFGDQAVSMIFADGGQSGAGGSLSSNMIVQTVRVDALAIAKADAVATNEATPVAGNLFADNGSGADSDPDGGTLAVAEVNGSAANVGHQIILLSGALLTVKADGSYSYDPNHAFDATPAAGSGAANISAGDTFTYTLANGGTATVTVTIAGVDSNDTLQGTGVGDALDGGAGNDLIWAGGGNDLLEGGAGNDILHGEAGNDVLADDSAIPGDEQLYGEDGNDLLFIEWFSGTVARTVLLDGGVGNDRLDLYIPDRFVDQATLIGGEGDDNIAAEGGLNVAIDAGAGADRVGLRQGPTNFTVTLGTGADVLSLSYNHSYPAPANVVVTDFATGDIGDRFELLAYCDLVLTNWNQATNPFATGHLRLLQSGADTIVQIDRDGAASAQGFVNLVTFPNVTASALTAFNLGGFPSDGSKPLGLTITGTASANTLTGTLGDDVIQGLGGDDSIRGRAGDDQIDGGDNNDSIAGDQGDDVIHGGGGSDGLSGGLGDDLLYGEADNDSLGDRDGGDDQLFGAAGYDWISVDRSGAGPGDTILIDAGADGALIQFFAQGRYADTVTIHGSDSIEASDDISVNGGGIVTVDAGAGDDRVSIGNLGGAVSLTLGAGTDSLYLLGVPYGGVITVEDFTGGGDGDRIYVHSVFYPYQMIQRGGDAIFQVDMNGSAAGGFVDYVIVRDALASDFYSSSDEYFWMPGDQIDDPAIAVDDTIPALEGELVTGGALLINDSDLDGPALSIATVNGSAANVGQFITLASGAELRVTADGGWDYRAVGGTFAPTPDFSGSGASNLYTYDSFTYTLSSGGAATVTVQVRGVDSADTLRGTAGNDTLSGGYFDDLYYVENAGDVVVEQNGGGNDRVVASTSYALGGNAQVETLEAVAGTAPINLTGNYLAQTLIGNAGSNLLHGGGGADILRGLGGDDIYYADIGSVQVEEGAGGGTDRLFVSLSYALAGGSEVEVLSTNNHASTQAINLTGNSFNQTLIGNAGENILHGGGGTDLLIGLGGRDIYYIDVASTSIVEYEGGGNDALYVSLSYTLVNGEVEVLSTNSHAATAAINLTGNLYNQTLIGNAGNNVLNGGGGTDLLIGLAGNDTYYVDVASVAIVEYESGGNDTLYASTSYVLVNGEVETLSVNDYGSTLALNLTGNLYAQTLIGNAGSNALNGGGGIDTLIGLGGNDIYYVDVAGTQVTEAAGAGTDAIYTSVSYTLAAGSEVEILSSNNYGATDAISLTGNASSQVVTGNAGANTLNGGGGADTLYGLGGADNFAFTTALGGGNVDSIADFSVADDTIQLEDAVFTAIGAMGALNPNAFATGAAAADADDRIIYNSATGQLFYDADGNGAGAAVQFATLASGLALTANDFQVI